MQAADLLARDFPVLSPTDDVQAAVDIFLDTCVCHIPVINEDKILQGVFPVDILASLENKKQPIVNFKADWLNNSVFPDQPGLFIFELISRLELSAIPVVNENREYIGTIETQDLLKRIGSYYSFMEPGGLITLILGPRDYNLSEISRIVESNNAKILTLYLEQIEKSDQLRLTLKISTTDLSHIFATFERFRYNIDYYTSTATQQDELKDRYDLMIKLFDL